MKTKTLGKLLFATVALGVGAGIVGSTQISDAIRSGSVDVQSSAIGRMLASVLEPQATVAAPPVEAAASAPPPPAAEVQRPAVFAQVQRVQEPPAPLPAACQQSDPTAAGAVVGDRLRLRFFERTVLGGGQPDADIAAADIAYERLDLSGTFDVNEEGEISVPLAGRITVAGMNLYCIEQATARRMFEANRTLPMVSASHESRPPLTVRGAVRAPGSYQFSPAMTVEGLLALAGSAADGGVQDAQYFLMLLSRRAEMARAELGILLRTKRAYALLANSATLGLSMDESGAVQTLLGGDRLVVEEAALAAEAETIKAEEADIMARMDDYAKLETETLRMQAKVQTQYDDLSRRREELLKLKERGVASAVQLDGISFNVIMVERELLDLQKAVLQIRSSVNTILQEANVAAKKRRANLAVELRDLAEESETLRGKRDTLEAELAMYEGGLTPSGKGLRITVEITRVKPGGVETFGAARTDALRPGDVLTVTAALPTYLGKTVEGASADLPADTPLSRRTTDTDIK